MLFHFSQAKEGVFVCFPEKPVSAQAVKKPNLGRMKIAGNKT